MGNTLVQKYTKRLAEIAEITFGTLSDDQVLQFLAERKHVEGLKRESEQAAKEEERVRQAEKEKAQIEKELARLNALISPDKDDDELLRLIEERKVWEEKLVAVGGTPVSKKSVPVSKVSSVVSTEAPSTPVVSAEPAEKKEVTPPPSERERVSVVTDQVVREESTESSPVDEGFGEHAITDVALNPGSELGQAFERIKHDTRPLGKILDDLPVTAKRDKLFMLAVATIDPAYAMHYADKDVLKRDEDFNLRVIAINGKQTSGSVLAEMLPEARTAAVVMAAVKRDYRDIRFALPQMDGYDLMIARAKKAALEKAQAMKESVDVALLIPKILQKDKEFMAEVEKLAVRS
ncbi:MAG: hypothetical protein WA082_03135 [Candidatus Moraniibacteriota bacterium]